MASVEVSDEELALLDIILNVEPVNHHLLSGFMLKENLSLTVEHLDELLDTLSKKDLVTIEKDQYQGPRISIKSGTREKIIGMLAPRWESKKIFPQSLTGEAEKNFVGVIKMLELASETDGKFHITFSDYYSDIQVLSFCEKLTQMGFILKQLSASRKHSYQEFYFRRIPLDTRKVLEDFVVEKVNLKGLNLDTDWRILTMILFFDSPLTLEDLKLNLLMLTSDDVNDILFNLEARGVISRENGQIKIAKATRDIVKSYFFLNQYQAFKSKISEQLRKTVGERPSNLYLLGLVKRILSSMPQRKDGEPFSTIKKALLKDINEKDLGEASKLGLILFSRDQIVIAHEVLFEIESIIKTALSEETFMTIPPNELHTAVMAWRRIFGTSEEYVKIQDEFINEEALEIIHSYTSVGIEIVVLTSTEGARDLDLDEMKRYVETVKKSGKKIELYFVGYETNRKAPFHERYIITKDMCYSLSSSIKQVGKSKSTSITVIPKHKREGEVEPSFEYWIHAPLNKLKEKGIVRMNFEDWLKTR
ncbi:MAG: hypothetical protein QXP36_04570 [Conexivisphaerales archaeon]